MGFLDRITQGLKKTRDAMMGQAAAVLRPGHKLTDEDYEQLEEALLRADVGPAATDRVLEGVRERLGTPGAENDPGAAIRGRSRPFRRGRLWRRGRNARADGVRKAAPGAQPLRPAEPRALPPRHPRRRGNGDWQDHHDRQAGPPI